MSNPVRSCLVTRTRHDQKKLLRFVWSKGQILWDNNHSLPGRGAYLQAKVDIIDQSRQVKIWRRAFRLNSEQLLDFVNLNQVLDGVLEQLQSK